MKKPKNLAAVHTHTQTKQKIKHRKINTYGVFCFLRVSN